MKWLPWGLGAGIFLLLAAPRCWNPTKWEADRDAQLAGVEAREQEAQLKLRLADSLTAQANRTMGQAERLTGYARQAVVYANRLRDSLLSLGPAPDTCLPWLKLSQKESDSLRSALRLDSLALDTLHSALNALQTANLALGVADSLHKASSDSLRRLVARVPKERWWVPSVSVGYGGVVSQGTVAVGPGVLAGWKVHF